MSLEEESTPVNFSNYPLSMVICFSRRFIFIHIHKCGGTSLELAMAPFMKWNDLILGSTELGELLNQYYPTMFKIDKHSSINDLAAVAGMDFLCGMHKFALVRHPVARMCSIYNYVGSIVSYICSVRELTPRDLRNPDDQLLIMHPELRWCSVIAYVHEDFSQFIRNKDLALYDPSFRTQKFQLSIDDQLAVDSVYKLEEISSMLPSIQNIVGCKLMLKHENKSPIRYVDASSLDSKDMRYILDKYQDDLVAFDY